MTIYQSQKRFSKDNDTGMTATQLKEQLDSIGLPEREPQSPSTYEMFGSDEDKYQPSEFLPKGSNDVQFINFLEYAGNKIAFRSLVKALTKKLTTGRAKPERAIAYGEYFTYLGKSLIRAVTQLEEAKAVNDSYLKDKIEFNAINEIYHDQLKYEQKLSSLDWQTIDLEEQQERQNTQLVAKNAQLEGELEEVKSKQGKLTSLVQKFMSSGINKTKGENQ